MEHIVTQDDGHKGRIRYQKEASITEWMRFVRVEGLICYQPPQAGPPETRAQTVRRIGEKQDTSNIRTTDRDDTNDEEENVEESHDTDTIESFSAKESSDGSSLESWTDQESDQEEMPNQDTTPEMGQSTSPIVPRKGCLQVRGTALADVEKVQAPAGDIFAQVESANYGRYKEVFK